MERKERIKEGKLLRLEGEVVEWLECNYIYMFIYINIYTNYINICNNIKVVWIFKTLIIMMKEDIEEIVI